MNPGNSRRYIWIWLHPILANCPFLPCWRIALPTAGYLPQLSCSPTIHSDLILLPTIDVSPSHPYWHIALSNLFKNLSFHPCWPTPINILFLPSLVTQCPIHISRLTHPSLPLSYFLPVPANKVCFSSLLVHSSSHPCLPIPFLSILTWFSTHHHPPPPPPTHTHTPADLHQLIYCPYYPFWCNALSIAVDAFSPLLSYS